MILNYIIIMVVFTLGFQSFKSELKIRNEPSRQYASYRQIITNDRHLANSPDKLASKFDWRESWRFSAFIIFCLRLWIIWALLITELHQRVKPFTGKGRDFQKAKTILKIKIKNSK